MEVTAHRFGRSAALLAAAFLACGLLAGCGDDDAAAPRDAAPVTHAPLAGPTPTEPPTMSDPPGGAADVAPRPGSIRALKEQCFAETVELVEAYLTYSSPFRLEAAQTRRFTARLVQDPVLAGAAGDDPQGHVKVACSVDARLVTADEEVATADREWVTQTYLPPDETSWTWLVTGRKPGRSDAVVQLRPVVRIEKDGGELTEEPLGTQSFEVTFSVSRSAGSWISSTAGRVVGLAGGITALTGAVLGLRALSGRRGASAA